MNLGVITPDNTTTTSLYRAMGPLSALRPLGVRLLTFPGWGWVELMQCDALFIHRPYHPMHRNIVRMAKGLGVPVWLDFDDDLVNVPYWHPAAVTCGKEYQELLGHLFQMADVVSVSTPAIQESYVRRFANDGLTCDWRVIPNAMDPRIFPSWAKGLTPERERMITWRSGPANSHMQDLETVLPAMGRVAKQFPDWKWVFLGGPHWNVVDVLGAERVKVIPGQDFFGYAASLALLRPAIHIVPLVDSPFNRAKSNCAWIEATAAGALVVGPRLPEWERPGILNYLGADEFGNVLELALMLAFDQEESKKWREEKVRHSREYIARKLMLDTVNKQRMAILEGFM